MMVTGKTQLVMGMRKNFDPSVYFCYRHTKLVYFVDELKLPDVDTYNTQSAIAHLRQHMEYEHCYDLSKMTLKNISNTQVVSCMNPTAGCFNINPRLQRWFATFAMVHQTFFVGHLHNFADAVKDQRTNLIKAALGHSLVSTSFRKTATNFHYKFNIRHISNVFLRLLVSTPENFKTADKLTLLWLHGDRLVSKSIPQHCQVLRIRKCRASSVLPLCGKH